MQSEKDDKVLLKEANLKNINDMKEKNIQNEEDIITKKKNIERYCRLSEEYNIKRTVPKLETNKLSQILLDLDSVMIETSEYIKDGGNGGKGEEWPWKVMDK
jgi:hypothetical protein